MNRTGATIPLLAFFVATLALHLAGNWLLPLLDRDETRFAEASREMRQSGNYIVPTFNNQPRYDKPPLTYWCQVLAYKLLGETEFAARLHSAIAAALTSLVIFGFCSRLYGEATAWRAAIAFALCLQTFIHARAAVADMLMVLFVALASWAGWELCAPSAQSKRCWWWLFYLALAAGFLVKGPVALFPLGALFIYAKWGSVPGFWRSILVGRGLGLSFSLVAIWGIPALVQTHGEFLRVGIGRHVFARSFTAFEGHGGHGPLNYIAMLPYYFVTIFATFFPWSIWLPRTVRALKKNRTPADMYLLSGVAFTFCVFTLVKTKLPHYTLPAFPLLTCLVAPHLRAGFKSWAVGLTVFFLAIALFAFPKSMPLFPVKALVEKSAPLLVPAMEFASVEYDEPGLLWYFRRHIRGWHELLSPSQIPEYMARPGPRLCVMPEATPLEPGWQVITADGYNFVKGKRSALKMVLKTDPASIPAP